jgi:hypothetical protein
MLPISGDNMGSDAGRIAILFHNGVEVVDGFLIAQIGTRRYLVSDGAGEFKVILAKTVEAATNLQPGYATILCYPNIDGTISTIPEHIKTITMFTCNTVEGHRYGWRFDRADQPGECNIARIPAA